MHTFFYQLPGEPAECGPIEAKNKREALAKIREQHKIVARGLKVRRAKLEQKNDKVD